jgi:2-polyprenyl-3-methyl-5-hydroxy-6-metoxy-1,4-benzoquinol methylase
VQLLLNGEIGGLSKFLHKLAIRRMIKEINPYHPISIEGEIVSTGERDCSDRWFVINEVISKHPGSVLDLGCAEGYFVQRAAREHGCFVLGVDADVRRLTVAQDVNVLNRNERAGFMYAHITPEFLGKLPTFDTVIFLSVLHHVMYEHGVDHARDFMKLIREKTAKSLIFDMGQSNETAMQWASLLPDMGANPEEWIAEFLRSCGFSEVIKVGETDAFRSNVSRAVFVAHP